MKDAVTHVSKCVSFRITETDAEIEARMEKWDKYLEQEDEEKAKKKQETKSSNEEQKVSQWECESYDR